MMLSFVLFSVALMLCRNAWAEEISNAATVSKPVKSLPFSCQFQPDKDEL